MLDLADRIARLGGAASRPELLRMGATDAHLGMWARDGVLIRVRCGWYALPEAEHSLVEALRVGGRRTCATSLAARGIWVLDDGRVHIAVRPTDARLRSRGDRRVPLAQDPGGVALHWSDGESGVGRFDVDVASALRHLASHGDAENLLAAVDSARAIGALTDSAWRRLCNDVPQHCAPILARSRADAGSGIESIVRIRLEDAGFIVRTQQELARGIRVDLVIGDCLVIETDGRAFHDAPHAFEKDRERDLVLKGFGFRVIRLTFRQVMNEWPSVEAAIRLVVSRRGHLWA